MLFAPPIDYESCKLKTGALWKGYLPFGEIREYFARIHHDMILQNNHTWIFVSIAAVGTGYPKNRR